MTIIDWFNDNSGAIQAVATIVLVIVTIIYARSTGAIADKTKDMAIVTEAMTEMTRIQRLDSVRPVVSFAFGQDGPIYMDAFQVIAANVGVGPALDFTLELKGSPIRFTSRGPAFPTVVEKGGQVVVGFTYEQKQPFTDPCQIRWPRDEEDAELQAAVNAQPIRRKANNAIKGQQELQSTHSRRDQRFREFTRDVVEESRQFQSAGLLIACYRDLHGRSMQSSVELRAQTNPSTSDWNHLVFGPIMLENHE